MGRWDEGWDLQFKMACDRARYGTAKVLLFPNGETQDLQSKSPSGQLAVYNAWNAAWTKEAARLFDLIESDETARLFL